MSPRVQPTQQRKHPFSMKTASSIGIRVRLVPLARSFIAALVCAGLLLSGCTTMQSVPVPIPSGPAIAVQVGDHIEVQTKNGQTLTFQVTQIEPAALAGKDIRVKYDDIAGLQVKRVDKVRTAALTIGIIAGVVLVADMISALASLSP
jgi:hypothetical protein